MRNFIVAFCLLLLSINLAAQGIVHVNETNNKGEFSLEGNIFYLIDSTDQYTFEQVLSEEFEGKFIQSASSVFSFKRNAPSQWYKIRIQNNTNHFQQMVLAINNPLISDITFYNTFDSVYYNTGFLHPFKQRQIKFKNYLFEVKILAGQQGVICFKVSSQLQPEYLPVSLISSQVVSNKLRVSAFIEGLFYCALILFLFLIGILWRSEKRRSFIYFMFFVIFMGLVTLWRDGYFFQFVWPNAPSLNYLTKRVFYAFLLFFILLFEYNYLKIKKATKYLAIIAKLVLTLSLVFALSQLFVKSYNYYYFGFRLLLILVTVVFIWGYYAARKMNLTYKWLYLIGFGFIIADLLLTSFILVGSIGIGFYDIQVSTLIIILFFFIIINIFVSKFKKSRLEVIGLNKNLELLVEKRTHQLSSQKEELKSQHEELLQQKETLQTQREELRAQKELLELKNIELIKLSLVASKTDNLIYIFNPSGELDWFNTSFSKEYRLNLEEYQIGTPLSISDISLNKNIRHVLNTCLREKIVVSYESKKIDEENENNNKWYHTTLTPILDERENIKYLIAIDTDITRLKHYEYELNQQRKDAEHQKHLAIMRKEELEERQVEITDSIRYAKRIQTGIMPKVKQIQRDFHDSFVLFLPKDIVSGDFYWYHRIKDKYFVAVVDCTGHGVPGAFMSIIGTYLLNSIIIYNGVDNAAEILKQLNRKIKIALKSDSRSQTSDGMDISIAIIDKNQKSIEFASALRPFYLFSNGDFIEVKGDKIPITSSISGTTINSFTNYNYDFNEGDMFYLFSDGIIDQFGGKHGKKFLTKRFKQLLFEINPLSMSEQKDIIKKAYDEWRGDNEQVDDILVMGIRYKDEIQI